MLTVAVSAGLRPGELFGLRRQKVDFPRRTLAVEEQLTAGKGRFAALTPRLKTPPSSRRLPVPDAVTRALSQVLEVRPDADVFLLRPRSQKLRRRQHFIDNVWEPTSTRPAYRARLVCTSCGTPTSRTS